MLLKNSPDTAPSRNSKVIPFQTAARELESLYARRSALDALIQSLEEYQRFRARRLELSKLKTA